MERRGNAFRPRLLSQGVFEGSGEGAGETARRRAARAATEPEQRGVKFGRRRVAHDAGVGRDPSEAAAEDLAQRSFEIAATSTLLRGRPTPPGSGRSPFPKSIPRSQG